MIPIPISIGIVNFKLADALAERAMQHDVANQMNSQNIANIAWAFAKVPAVPLLQSLTPLSNRFRFKTTLLLS